MGSSYRITRTSLARADLRAVISISYSTPHNGATSAIKIEIHPLLYRLFIFTFRVCAYLVETGETSGGNGNHFFFMKIKEKKRNLYKNEIFASSSIENSVTRIENSVKA